jgi:hypothetical protein
MRSKTRAVLIDALRDAHLWLDQLTADADQTVEALAAHEGKTARWIRRTLSLAFLSSTLVKAAIEGRLPRGLGSSASWTFRWRGQTNGRRSGSRRPKVDRTEFVGRFHWDVVRAPSAPVPLLKPTAWLGRVRTQMRSSLAGCLTIAATG